MTTPGDTVTDFSHRSFSERYGPWALIIGASEGVGATYARAVAERGLNVALVARRQTALDEVAAGIRATAGVETKTLAIDLSEPDAMSRLLEGTADLEVGLVFYCAGADANFTSFLDLPIEVPLAMVQRNCVVPMQVSHHFGGKMVERGRGGITLVSSGAGLAGAPNMVGYAATKAFDMVMAEALWAELHDLGVDVLALVLGLTDTPALRRLMVQRGALPADDPSAPIVGASTPDEVVAEALANLTEGPTYFVGEMLQAGAAMFATMTRNDVVKMMVQMGASALDNSESAVS
jgi:short-subunit dehydrogenase